MKKTMFYILTVLLAYGIGMAFAGVTYGACNVPICKEQGGAKMTVGTGGEIEVQSGATLDMQSGSTINLHGSAMSSTEFGYLDGTTPGTQQANKVVVPDDNVNIGTTKVTGLHIGTSGSETEVTATGAELNYVDLPTIGTIEASKAVVVNANKDISGFNDVGVDGDLTINADSTGGNAGARSQLIGLPAITLVSTGTMTNGTTETTAYIDATPTGEWAEVDAGTNVVISADTTYWRDVTNSLKIAFADTAVENDGVDGTISQDDLSANESIGFWIYSDQALTAGDLDLTVDDTDGTDQVYSIPAVAANVWTWAEIDISGCDANCDTADGIQIALSAQGAAAFGVSTGQAVNVYIDAMYKWDADDEETLGVNLVQDGVLGYITEKTDTAQDHTMTKLVEYTDYFIHYQSGNDAAVTITDQSTYSGTALVAYQ